MQSPQRSCINRKIDRENTFSETRFFRKFTLIENNKNNKIEAFIDIVNAEYSKFCLTN